MSKLITIDGPAGVGKGSVSKHLAKILNARVLNSGEIYRSIAYNLKREKINHQNKSQVIKFVKSFKYNKVSKKYLYARNIDIITSEISAIPEVRKEVINLQHDFLDIKNKNNHFIIAEGRDMGSKIFPKAQIKIFLWANSEVRAKRRYLQVKKTRKTGKFEDILLNINTRDARDMSRKVAPLRPAEDSYLIDNSNLDIEQCFNIILKIIKRHNINK